MEYNFLKRERDIRRQLKKETVNFNLKVYMGVFIH